MINRNLMLVTMLSVGTALTTLGKVKPVAASLTPPTTYDYSYTWNATASEQYLNVYGVDSIPLYTRTADGVYYNYTSTFDVIDGLEVTMTFNRSNTAWQASGTYWKPDEDKIGNNGTVGSVVNKVYLEFFNQSKNYYRIYVDTSSYTQFFMYYYVDGVLFDTDVYYFNNTLTSLLLPSYTNIRFHTPDTGGARGFDAWYLQDLGISDSWQEGYDANRQGILTDYLGTDAQQIGWVLLGIAAILFVFKGGK